MKQSLQELLDKIQAGVDRIQTANLGECELETAAQDLCDILSKLPTDYTHIGDTQIQACAVKLWNIAVARKVGGHVSATLNAKLRHVACSLIFLCHVEKEDTSTRQKQLMMALKTSRAWLDSGKPSMADFPLTLAMEGLEKLRECGVSSDSQASSKNFVDASLFKVMCYRAEAAFGQENVSRSMELVLQAKELLLKVPTETSYLAMLAYNLGVDCFQAHSYEHAVNWLRESYEIGKGNIASQNQARTLRLLANAYLEWDGGLYWQKALNVIGLANAEHCHTAGLFLKLRILLEGENNTERIEAALEDLMSHADLTSELGLSVIKLLRKKELGLALGCLKQLRKQFEKISEAGLIGVVQLETLLQAGKLEQAASLVNEYITDNANGDLIGLDTRKQFHLLLWDQAARLFEAKSYETALEWYGYSCKLHVATTGLDEDLAKLHRNRATCLLNLQQVSKAAEAIDHALKCNPDSPHSYYLGFKVALTQDDDEKALSHLNKMSEVIEASGQTATMSGFISLAAQLALENTKRSVAVEALEQLIKRSSSPQQLLVSLRCLIRLRLTDLSESNNKRKETGAVIGYLKMAYETLEGLPKIGTEHAIAVEDETTWFMKIAWNMAIELKENYKSMMELFLLCSQLTGLCAVTLTGLVRQKTCLLMAAAASLQIARDTKDKLDMRCALQEAVDYVKQCRVIYNMIQDFKDKDANNLDVTTPVLLILYEFEACIKLADPEVEAILEQALALPQAEPKAFESMAALAMEGPVKNKSACMRALKVAIKKHLQAEQVDFSKCGKAFHSLIEISLEGTSSMDPSSKEEAWGYYMDVFNIIQNAQKDDYPEMEIVWLMTRAWNVGVHLFSASKYSEAGQWCDLAMKLLNHLGSLKDTYSSQMSTVYKEISARLGEQESKVCYTL